MKTGLKILAGILTLILAAACLLPSLSVNITAHVAKGESWHAGSVYIVAVVVAALAIIARRIAKRSNDFDTARGALLLAAVLLSFNVLNAWNSSTISRGQFGDPRKAENVIITRLEGEEKFLTEILAKSPPRASAVVQAEIDAKLQNPKAEGCPVGGKWNGPVTSVVCPEVGTLRTELAAADDYEKKHARLTEVRDLLNNPEKRKHSTTDPTVENLGAVIGLAFTVTEATQKWIGVGADLHVALVVETLAVLGPDICLFLFLTLLASMRREPEIITIAEATPEIIAQPEIITIPEMIAAPEPPEPIEEEAQPAPALPRAPQRTGGKVKTRKGRGVNIPASVQRYFDEATINTGKPDDDIGATEFFDAYVEWCADSGEVACTGNMFGRAASATFKKAEARTNRYIGVKLRRKPKLKAVK